MVYRLANRRALDFRMELVFFRDRRSVGRRRARVRSRGVFAASLRRVRSSSADFARPFSV